MFEFEHFVSPDVAAEFIGTSRKQLLALTRKGIIPGYPTGTGSKRKQWKYLLSEIRNAITSTKGMDRIPEVMHTGPRSPRGKA